MSSADNPIPIELCPTCGEQYADNTGFCPADGDRLMRQVPDPLIGSALPRHYRITEKIGKGAMSIVYKGIYEPLDQPVAIKLLKTHLVSDLSTFKRFQQEAKTAGALDHPNVVSILDFGVTDQGVPYLIMELLQGESLHQRIRREQRLPIDSALRIFIQTADALEYTHQYGVIHRDVKPSNILIEYDDQGLETAKIVDFGIAKLQNYEGNPSLNLTHTGEVFGTPLYVSPEQAMGRSLDIRADVYSLGCVMYESIAGRPPFFGPTAFDVLRLQITEPHRPIGDYRPLGEVPPTLVAAIDKAMSKDPGSRHQSMQELLMDLQRAEMEFAVAREAIGGSSLTPTVAFTTVRGVSPTPATPFNAYTYQEVASSPTSATPLQGLAISGPQSKNGVKHKSPFVPFAMSSVAGCLAGIFYLYFTHGFVAAPEPAYQRMSTSAQAVATERNDAQSAALDADTTKEREDALSAYDDGNFVAAEQQINDALTMARNKHEKIGEGLLLADLCMIEIEQHKLSDAYEAGNTGLQILDGNPFVSKKDLSFALRGFGTACFYRGDYKVAEGSLKRSVDLDRGIYGQADERYAIGLGRLAKVYESDKKPDLAEKYYRQALAVSERAHQKGDPHLSTRLGSFAKFLRSRHRIIEAVALERRAREVDK